MATAHIRLAHGLPEDLAPELEKRLFFVSSRIDDFALIRRDGVVEAIELAVSSPAADTVRALEDKINHLVEKEILAQRVLPPKVAWRSPAATERIERFVDAFPLLVRNGTAFEAGEGQVGFGEPLISLMDYFDRRLRAVAMSFEGAREYRYPTLLPTSVLDRFGYFASFPQFVMFVTRLHNDIDVYNAFVADYEAEKKITPRLFAHCSNHDYCLPPTMCYHSYHQYQGRRLDRDTVVTAKGKSFRFESKYHSGLSRLWDFTIREIVFMGTPEFALACRQSAMQQAFSLMEEFGLSGTCEVANDLFFRNGDTASKILSQRMMDLKYELLLNVGPEKSIAVASFNVHGPFFGEAFEITQAGGGQPIASGCVGFGLERLVYAFLCQHGLDDAHWPAAVRMGIG